jgi:glycosyltransferase involved in cell wall biosynthesis
MNNLEQARNLYKQQKYKEARRLFDQEYNTNRTVEAIYGSALCDYELNDFQNSMKKLNQILTTHPNNHLVYNQIGMIAFKVGDKKTAETMFEKAIELKPDFEDGYLNLLEIIQDNSGYKKYSLLRRLSDTFPANEIYCQKAIDYIDKYDIAKSDISILVERLKSISPNHTLVKKYINEIGRPKELIIEKTQRPLNILFLQNTPCIRNYKYAQALKSRGHKVTLAYTDNLLSQRYTGLSDDVYEKSIKISDYRYLWDISENFDLIHSHNEPDTLTVAAFAAQCPVIHDTHDLISLRDVEKPTTKYFEGIANRGATGRIYSTPYQQAEAKFLYGVTGPSIVYYNYASAGDIPDILLEKKSAKDGNIHIVYEGGISTSKHRNFIDIFTGIASLEKTIHIHIYPARWDTRIERIFSDYNNIHYYHPVSPKQIIREMSQYDFGIIPWNLNTGQKRFLDSTIANKLFEYLAAGLPVFTSDVQSYVDYFKDNPVGMIFYSADDLVNKIPILKEKIQNVDLSKYVFTYESEIERLEKFYNEIVDNYTQKRNDHIPDSINIKKILSNLLDWVENNGWAGYDPYDVEDFIINHTRIMPKISEKEIAAIRALNESEPLLVRQKLKIEKRINAKGMGLFLATYSILYRISKDSKYLIKAEEIANWLTSNKSTGYYNSCWGYPFDWQSKVFIPMGTPSVVVSTVVAEGFWELYKATNDKKYLDECISVSKFIKEDLNIDNIDENTICFSYTPIDDFHVHNANLFAAEHLIRIGKEIGNHNDVDMGKKAANYAIKEQNPDGSIFYWGKIQDHYNSKHLDSYHSGFEIRMLFSIFELTNDSDFKYAYQKYLSFFNEQYLLPNGKVNQFPISTQRFQVNIHNVAEAILLFSKLSINHSDLLTKAKEIINWASLNLLHREGWFGYIQKGQNRYMIPFIRWGEGWMARALSEYILRANINNFNINYGKKTKICHIGGAHSIHISELVEELDKLGYDQCIISYMPVEKSITPRHIPVYYYNYRNYPNSPSELSIYAKSIESFLATVFTMEKPDIVNGHSSLYSALAATIAKIKFNLPMVIIPWSTHNLKNGNKSTQTIENQALVNSDRILVGSKEIFNYYKTYYKEIKDEQFVLFRPLLPLELYHRLRIVSDIPRILSIRVMGNLYRQDLLIQVLSDIIKADSRTRATFLIGQHPDQGRNYYNRMVELAKKLNVFDYCTFIDSSLSKEEFAEQIYSHNIIYSIAEHDEGYAGSTTMAMYSGAITISQYAEATKNELQHDVHLLKVKVTEDDIRDKLIYAINNMEKLQERFIKNNQFLSKFSKTKMIENLTNVYSFLMNNRM